MAYRIVWLSGGSLEARLVEAPDMASALARFRESRPPGSVPASSSIETEGGAGFVRGGSGRRLLAIVPA